MLIHKEPKSALSIDFKHPDDVVSVMGHTRHSTQGSEKKNHNNHPFPGKCKNLKFALAHNGVLFNDYELKKKYCLPDTKIETDSYVAVQLIEKKKILDIDSVKFMAETTEGSFAYSIIDSSDTLWLVRGDSPLALVHIPKYKLYVYASTEEILYKALVDTELLGEVKNGGCKSIHVNSGEILRILPDGTLVSDKFNYVEYRYPKCNWWEYGTVNENSEYISDLKMIAEYYGYSENDVDEMLCGGCSPEEIEDLLYCY